MHEISAVHGILQSILQESDRQGFLRVTRAEVSVNRCDGLLPENLVHWFEFMGKDTRAEGARLIVRALGEGEEACPRPGDIRLDIVEGIETQS